ncbi:unnamed protein product [Diabrotica balteata]|uniref:receptor protein-tyrosine kinase n=1 Tax=Diabrotica balteata TaxID=107213 RepID=A0A9N9XAF7_DIABA|nr:unnamed protein product [Diabrotica balteata]
MQRKMEEFADCTETSSKQATVRISCQKEKILFKRCNVISFLMSMPQSGNLPSPSRDNDNDLAEPPIEVTETNTSTNNTDSTVIEEDNKDPLILKIVKIYYIVCPEVTVNFARFPSTPTGKEITLIEQATGTCVSNAEVVGATPTYLCKGDGKWTLPTGGCKCKAGFQPDMDKQTCNECQQETYKAEIGDGPCLPCPAFSQGPHYGLTECRCISGYYRAPSDPKNMSCTQPPSAPQNLTVSFVDQSTVILSWLPPETLGGRTDTAYRIKCDVCSLGLVQYNPSMIFAENGVSHMSMRDSPQYADIVVTTEASVASSITNIRVTSVKSTEITLAWDAPSINDGSDNENDLVETYEIRWFQRNDIDYSNNSLLISDLSVTITGLQQRTEYGLQVRAKTQRGWGAYSPVIFKTTGQILNPAYIGEEEGLRLQLVAGGIVAVVVILVAVIVLTVVFLRSRSNDECNKKQPSDCDTLEYRNGEVTTPLFTGISGSSRTYIDPHTYEDPNQAVREFAREIDASCITIEAIIGGGEFGDVCRGKLKMNGVDIDVAIKTLKAGSLDKSRNDFLTEASIMGQFEHPNVIFLQGVVTKSNPVMIITEYMENGSLDTFLRANDGKFQVIQLTGMLRGIASGMQYLSEMNYVHRDLAARNVLVNSQLVCKIADFGLSREIESATEGAYTTRGGKIPVRWTAPEAIAFRKFTSASDVWSMGIVCWEVMSYGERPYWNWSNQDVIKSIEKGYRLPAPMDCPEAIYQLMLDCWQKERTHRPTFQSIVKTLDKLIRVPDTLRKIAQNRCQLPYNLPWPSQNIPSHITSVMQLSELPHLHHNPYFGSLQRRINYAQNVAEVETHPYYGLPDVILLQNYGVVSDITHNELDLRRRLENEYRNSVIEHEMKQRFSSLLNLKQDNLFEANSGNQLRELNTNMWLNNNFGNDSRESNFKHKSPFYPNIDIRQNIDGPGTANMFFDDGDEYDQQTENFFGKKPDLFNDNNDYSKRPDHFFTQMINKSGSDLLELSEQFSDNFKDESSAANTSSDNLFNDETNVERVEAKPDVADTNNAQTGGAWVNFVNV